MVLWGKAVRATSAGHRGKCGPWRWKDDEKGFSGLIAEGEEFLP